MAHCQVIIMMRTGILQSQYLFNQGNVIDHKCFIVDYANRYIYIIITAFVENQGN